MGSLVIGDVGVLKPRVCEAFGEGATNVFDSVVGKRREERHDLFERCMDGISNGILAKRVVAAVAEFMDLNNSIMMALQSSLCWSKYFWGAVAVAAAAAAAAVVRKCK